MAFCREIHNIINILFLENFRNSLRIADIRLNKSIVRMIFHTDQIFQISSIGKCVHIYNPNIIVFGKHINNKIRADKTRSPGNQIGFHKTAFLSLNSNQLRAFRLIFSLIITHKALQRFFPIAHLVPYRTTKHPVIQGRICRSWSRAWIFLACTRSNIAWNFRKTYNFAGEIIPSALSVSGAVINTIFLCNCQLQQMMCQICRIGRISPLIVNNGQLSALFSYSHHRLYKVFPNIAI